jgi:hypothetical protein
MQALLAIVKACVDSDLDSTQGLDLDDSQAKDLLEFWSMLRRGKSAADLLQVFLPTTRRKDQFLTQRT